MRPLALHCTSRLIVLLGIMVASQRCTGEDGTAELQVALRVDRLKTRIGLATLFNHIKQAYHNINKILSIKRKQEKVNAL